jgi:hypothetical protein
MNRWEEDFIENCLERGEIKTQKQLACLIKIKKKYKNNTELIEELDKIKTPEFKDDSETEGRKFLSKWENNFINDCIIRGSIKTIKQFKMIVKIKNKAIQNDDTDLIDKINKITLPKKLIKLREKLLKQNIKIDECKGINKWEKGFIKEQMLNTKISSEQRKIINKINKKIKKENINLHGFIEYLVN